MRRVLRNFAVVAVLIVVPLALGILIVGPGTPSGRNTHSVTRVGHKVYAVLLEELGYRVERFERGLETPPRERAVLIALEPGPALLRDGGRYARGLLEWVAEGNAALVTLGPDPDRSAEIDDRDRLLGETARRALAAVKSVEQRAKARARGQPEPDQSSEPRQPGPGREIETEPRWEGAGEVVELESLDPSDSWDIERLAQFLGLSVSDLRLADFTATTTIAVAGVMAAELDRQPVLKITRPRAFRLLPPTPARAAQPTVLLTADSEPLLLELDIGRGKLLVLSEPRLFQNGALLRASHARLAVRTVERMAAAVGTRAIYFEEFSHGGREARNIFDLALSTAARWPVLQIGIVCLVWVAFVAGRRRSPVPFEVPPRRSRQEVIDAMASLFLRTGDIEGAARRLLELSRLRVARGLGAPERAHAPAALAQAFVLRTGRGEVDEIRACLEGEGVSAQRQLVERAERLRRLRVELDVER